MGRILVFFVPLFLHRGGETFALGIGLLLHSLIAFLQIRLVCFVLDDGGFLDGGLDVGFVIRGVSALGVVLPWLFSVSFQNGCGLGDGGGVLRGVGNSFSGGLDMFGGFWLSVALNASVHVVHFLFNFVFSIGDPLLTRHRLVKALVLDVAVVLCFRNACDRDHFLGTGPLFANSFDRISLLSWGLTVGFF